MSASSMVLAQSAAPTTLDGWAERLQKFGKGMQQEQIFIHTDNTCYFLGDTIYYKAYVRRSDGTPSKLSTVLYTELLNQDGYLVNRNLLELKDGQAHGTFVLQDTLYGGYYELRAYTRWQLNWGLYEHEHVKGGQQWFFNQKMAQAYYRDYEKLYSRVFPVYDKPTDPNQLYHDMTLRPLRRQYKADNAPLDGSVTFFPEGGHLIAGVPNRIAFEANNEEGLHLEGSLVVTDRSGAKVAEASTEQRGRGTIELTPKAGEKYKAQFTWSSNKAEANLPEVETDGVALRIVQEGGKVSLQASASGSAASEPLGLTVMNQGIMLDFRELGTGSSLTATFDGDKLQTGVCQFTVFNAQGKVYADRLAFVKGTGLKAQNLAVTGIPQQPAEPFAPVSFSIEGGQAGSSLSVAVRDAAHSEYLFDDGNILTEMLLSSQIRGFVENPGYFFEADDEEHNRALDLLLMIQGWRRYNWHDMATPGAFVLNHLPEKTPLLLGEVNNFTARDTQNEFSTVLDNGELFGSNHINYDNGDRKEREGMDKDVVGNADAHGNGQSALSNEGSATNSRLTAQGSSQTAESTYGEERVSSFRNRFNAKESPLKNEVVVHARFKKTGAEGVVGDVMTQKGTFSIQSPRFFDRCILHLAASDSTKWSENEKLNGYGWLENGETKYKDVNYPEFYVKLNTIYPRFVKPYTWYQCNLANPPKGSAIAPEWLNDGSRTLGQVTIGAKRKRYNKFDATKPAFVVDAYEALNEACDAGLCDGYFSGRNRFIYDVARTYIGDMNMAREYEVELRLNGKLYHYMTDKKQSDTSIKGMNPFPQESSNISDFDIDKFNHLKNLDKVYIYTDYSPRREGDKKYDGADQPTVTVDLHTYPNESMRETFRDRFYLLQGFSVAEDFYQPDYSNKPLPETKDYRRTLYWNPDLLLDDSGKAEVKFYNNGKATSIAVSAEGMAQDGTLYSGKSMPEDR